MGEALAKGWEETSDHERGALTYEQFLSSAEYASRRAEWVDGKVIEMTPASAHHQRLTKFLLLIFESWLEAHPGGEVFIPPFQMKAGPNLPGREPDLLYVAEARLDCVKTNYLDGPADLVVEIVGEDSRRRDREEKFSEYERGGVAEYWLIEPDRRRADFFALGAGGKFAPIPPDADGSIRSLAMKGLWIKPEWLWRSPLLTRTEVIAEWGKA